MSQTNKIIKFDVSARERLLTGVNILANAVKITMGPRGQNVVIEQQSGSPILTKDGVTVARAVNLKDKFDKLNRPPCCIILKSGKRKGEPCGITSKKEHNNSFYCGRHYKTIEKQK